MARTVGKKVRVGAFAGAVGIMAVGSAAWACTFQPRYVSLTDQFGPRGSTVTVTGEGTVPGGAVELRWNGVKGPQLAAATADLNGSFTALATIPDVAPDIYALVIVADGDAVSRATFEVVPEGPAPGAASLPGANAWSDGAGESALGRSLTSPASSSTDNFALSSALLGVGVVALASGAGVAAARRRRAAVTTKN